MAELSCRCLNVTIHLDNNEVQLGSPLKPSDLLIDVKKEAELEDLYEVELGVTGITMVGLHQAMYIQACVYCM